MSNHSSILIDSKLCTPESYNAALNSVQETGSAVEGVMRQSVLHCLQHYHVFMPGLAPCVGHDLFEGVVKYDIRGRRLQVMTSVHRYYVKHDKKHWW